MAAARGRRFLVQKHAATRLHYDLRLELDGVLLSWAVTRGPSLDPAEKRLAVRTEDHPVSYADFEGTIPKGEYGGGTVMLWDRGTWIPRGDPHEQLRSGKLRFELHGERMRGEWLLVRMGRQKRESWLLRKIDDPEADGADTLTATHLTSVKTGRSMEQIAAGDAAPERRQPDEEQSGNRRSSKRPAPRKSRTARTGAAITRHGVTITSPDRLQYPDAGIRKRDLADYYERVAERMLPHLSGRPLTLIRCPRGVGRSCFVQQHYAKGFPQAVRRVRLTETSGKVADHFCVYDLAGILACVQMGALELHGWGSRVDSLEKADRLVFDLDPDPALPFEAVIDAARLVRDRLGADGIESWPMLTGGKGIHVVASLEPTPWRSVKAYATRLAKAIARDEPGRYTAGSAKARRGGRIFIDYLRNERGITAVVPWSTRAKAGAPVAMPLDWDALESVRGAQEFDVRRVLTEALPEPPAQITKTQHLPRTS